MSTRSEVLRLHAEGLTSAAIGRAVGCSRERVRQILKNEGLTYNPRVLPTDEEIAALYAEGLTNSDIGREFGVSIQYVYEARKRVGSPGRIGGTPQLVQAEVERLLDLARQGWRQTALAAEFGIDQGVISKIMRRHGINRQPARSRKVRS